VDEIRALLADNFSSLRSLKVTYRAWHHVNRGTDNYLQGVFAAKGVNRFASRWHGEAGSRDADPGAILRFYDGTHWNVYNRFFRRYEVTARFAVPPYTDKIRSHPLLENLGWWPSSDPSSPPRRSAIRYFVQRVLENERVRVCPNQAQVDGAWCHVVEIPKRDRLWIDSALGVLRRREVYSAHESAENLVSFRLADYRQVAEATWLPHRMRRIYHPANYDIVTKIDEYVRQ
jgi:hypothetical protein